MGGCLVSLSIILHLVTLRQSPIEPGGKVGNSKLDPPVCLFHLELALLTHCYVFLFIHALDV